MTTRDAARRENRQAPASGRRLVRVLVRVALALVPTPALSGSATLAQAADTVPVSLSLRPRTGFADQIATYFDLWDDDDDGEISFAESSRRIPDPALRDEAAAALAAVHLAQRFEQWKQAPFSRGQLMAPPPPAPASAAVPEPGPRPGPGTGPAAAPGRLPPFERYYEECFAHIRATSRTLFAGDGPSLRALHQGPLGDCYFVATLGALVARAPGDVSQMVQAGSDGLFHVRFPNGEATRVSGLTDAEIALGSFARGQGLWLNVLEKAYGQLVARSLQRHRVFEDAIDAVGGGGHATAAMTLFTGCEAGVLKFRDDDSPPITSTLRVEGFLPVARARLSANLASRRLTCCGTTHAATPPGIAPVHLYAVLGFDSQTESVHVWNPWGSRFEPQGPPGIDNGYPVRDGHFFVPLPDFIRIFGSVIYETDQPENLD